VNKAYRVIKDRKDYRETKEHKARKEIRDRKAHKVHKEIKAQMDRKGRRESKEYKETLDLPEKMDHRALFCSIARRLHLRIRRQRPLIFAGTR
jgi:hypothetical protein